MADFDSLNYDIEKRLPEWWKGFGALEPINIYTQEIIISILETLLSSTGVVQPLNCWLTIPEEYTWFHHYKDLDEKLIYYNNGDIISNPTNSLMGGEHDRIDVLLPNTKRKCHAKIRLKLTGYSEGDSLKDNIIESLKLTNGKQSIQLTNIEKTNLIEISTEDHQILIDGENKYDLVEGFFDKIEPTIKNEDYLVHYIDNGVEKTENIPLNDENKETKITIECSDAVNFDLQIYLYKPTYVTEQNIRIATVSAFPIEWVRLYGYFCHPFNNKEGYEFLWEKKYSLESRTVYDKIAKQYDCERFYIQVKFHGIGIPISKGFPQEEYASDEKFLPNENLDKWGKIYGLPRRYYKENITEDEEPFTFPKYYPYSIEQDYWYEERIVNEYRFDEDYINNWFVKDTDLNNIARLECIYPFMNDIWVYTETINPDVDITHESIPIHINSIEEIEDSIGVNWENLSLLETNADNKPILLAPYNNETIKTNNSPYQSKKLKISFNLDEVERNTPKDIDITGIELKFKAITDVRSNYLKLAEDSHMLLPHINYHSSGNEDNIILEPITITGENKFWVKERSTYTIGGPNDLFNKKEITREQLFINKKLDFIISFINENDFLNAQLALDDITLKIYYKIIPDDYSIKLELNQKEFSINENETDINLEIVIENNSKKKILNKEAFLIFAPELELLSDYNSFTFDLDIDEKGDNAVRVPFSLTPKIFPEVTDSETDTVIDEGGIRTGYYDIILFCEDKAIKEEILIKEG